MGKKNPMPFIFDTNTPLPDPENALGNAATYNERKKALVAWHVTSDAKRTMAAIKSGTPLIEMGHEHQELGPGLYVSAIPQIWMGRAMEKWGFLESLTKDERSVLAAALALMILKQVQSGYIAEYEFERAGRRLDSFADTGNVGSVLDLAGQPYNIAFWEPSFLEPLGIEASKPPEVIEFTLKGTFLGFDNMPRRDELEMAASGGFSGVFLRSGLMTVAQLVVWDDGAVVGMRKVKL